MKAIAFLILFGISVGSAFSDDWSQWLGDNRDGVWREDGVRKDLPEKGVKVLWRTPVGWGYAGPSVAGGKVYVSDFVLNEGKFDPRSQGGQSLVGLERIHCLDAETGKPI